MLAAWLLAAGWAIAPAVELRWHAPPGCPDEAAVSAKLHAYLGEADAAAKSSKVAADVRALADGTWELTLAFDDGAGEPRLLTNATCEGLAEAAVVVVAIAVAPAPDPATTPEPALEPEPPTTVAPPPAPVDRANPAPPRGGRGPGRAARPVGLTLGIGGGIALGTIPFGFALAPSIAATGLQWRVGLAASWATRRQLRLPDLPASGSDLVQWAIGPEACWLAPVRPFLAVPLCGGFELGQVIATPVGLANGQRRQSLWASAVVTAALRFRLNARLALFLAPAAVITLSPTTVLVGGASEPLFRSAPVGLRTVLGFDVRVW